MFGRPLRSIAILASLFLVGCSTGHLTAEEKFDNPGKGMVIFLMASTSGSGDSYVDFSGIDMNADKFNTARGGVKISSGIFTGSQLASGEYFSTPLDPGWYLFRTFTYSNGVRTFIKCLAAKTVAFEVVAGSVSYIGEYSYDGDFHFKGFDLPSAQKFITSSTRISAPVIQAKTYSAAFNDIRLGSGFSASCGDERSSISFSSVPPEASSMTKLHFPDPGLQFPNLGLHFP